MEEHITYHQTPYLTISHLMPENQALMTWRKFVKGDEFKSAVSVIFKFIREYGITHAIADTVQMGGILPVDQHYLAYEAVPGLSQTPLTHLAVVSSESLFNQMAVRKILAHCKDITIAYFKTLNDARTWITRQQELQVIH